jgi:hypothetical protein
MRGKVQLSSPSAPYPQKPLAATHIVVGKVLAIYTRTEVFGHWEYTRRLAEV